MAEFINSCNGNHGNAYRIKLTVIENSTSTTNNTSNVTITVTAYATSNSYGNYGYANPTYIYVDGVQKAYNNPVTDYRNQAVNALCSWTGNITHNNDGKKTIAVSASFSSASSNLSGGSVSGNVTLTNIARKAKITVANSFNDEQDPTIEFSNPGGFTMNVWLEPNPGGTHYAIRNNIPNTGSYTWELTTEERNQLRQACTGTSCPIRLGIYTIISGTTYSDYADRTLTIINANPIFSNFTFEDTNATTLSLTGNSANIILGYSNIKATISSENKAEALKYATMSKYRFVIDNQSTDIAYADSGSVYGTINNATSGIYNLYAIDSRGNTTLVTKTANAIKQYTPISLDVSSCTVERDNNGVGDGAILSFQGTIWNDSFGQTNNSITNVVYEFKKTSSSTWITGTTVIVPTIDQYGNYTYTGAVRSDNVDYSWDLDASYDFRITVYDQLSSASFTLTPMASATPQISFADNGIGIMCDYDEIVGGLLQVGGKRIDNIYSGSEIKIGEWIDGKPVYEKTLTKTTTSGNNQIAKNDISSNLNKLISVQGITLQPSGNYSNLYYYNSTSDMSFAYYSYSGSNITIKCGSNYGFGTTYVTIKYTKTTD